MGRLVVFSDPGTTGKVGKLAVALTPLPSNEADHHEQLG